MHRTTTLLGAATGAVLAFGAVPAVAPGQGQKPKDASLTLDARPSTVVFGAPTTLVGDLRGSGDLGGVDVRLERDELVPLGDAFAPFATVRTASNGRFSASTVPQRNTLYRASAETAPRVQSPTRLVLVRMRVGLRVSTTAPRRGSFVTFRGSVLPAHDGARVVVQRRSATGRWVTVRRSVLTDAGDTRSAYRMRVRVRSDGTYRVKAVGDADHVNGFTRSVRLDAR